MNYLQLCQKLRQECGISGTGPTSVLSQTGEMQRITTWVSTAWNDIQNLHDTWRFMWAQTSQPLTAGGRIYDPSADWALSVKDWDFDTVKLYRTSAGIADEQFLVFMPWDEFKQFFNWGQVLSQRPTIFTKRPDDTLMFNYQLDGDYTLHADYWQLPTTLAADSDTPGIPTRYHDVIVWKAAMMYAEYEEAGVVYAAMQRRYKQLLSELERLYLPVIQMGMPLV